MIKIDGSYLEGGGQIIRTALAFSTLTGKPFKAVLIRKGRDKPGLKAQHLHAVKALKELCNAQVKGDTLGSTELEYRPGKLDFRNLNIDIGTAGSITLLLQAILPVAVFSDRKLTLKITGGTDTKHSMSADYFANVFLPYLRGYAEIDCVIEKRGYYPKGGGRIILKIRSEQSIKDYKAFREFRSAIKKENKPLLLKERGMLALIKGVSHASRDLMKTDVAERQAKTARYLLGRTGAPVKIEVQYNEALSTGSGITIWALFTSGKETEIDYVNPIILGADSIGEKGKKAEKVGQEAAAKLLREIESGAAADRHLGDQLLPFIALFGGGITCSEITSHSLTNMYVIEKFMGKCFLREGNSVSTIR